MIITRRGERIFNMHRLVMNGTNAGVSLVCRVLISLYYTSSHRQTGTPSFCSSRHCNSRRRCELCGRHLASRHCTASPSDDVTKSSLIILANHSVHTVNGARNLRQTQQQQQLLPRRTTTTDKNSGWLTRARGGEIGPEEPAPLVPTPRAVARQR